MLGCNTSMHKCMHACESHVYACVSEYMGGDRCGKRNSCRQLVKLECKFVEIDNSFWI